MRRYWWVVLVLAVPAIEGCRKVKKTTNYVKSEEEVVYRAPAHYMGEESCNKCHDWNVVAIHDSSSPQYRTDCIVCHGDKQDPASETTLAEGYSSIHLNMCKYVFEAAGQESMNDAVCMYCHETVDYFDQSGAGIRKQVDPDGCAQCHTSSGPGRQLYED